MPRVGPISRANLVSYLREIGFDGPFVGGKHQFMARGDVTVRVPNPHHGDISIDLLFVAAGHSFEELRAHLQMVTFDGIPIRTLDIDGMLMTKQTSRDTDIPDRKRLRQLRDALRAARPDKQAPTA